MFAEHAHNSVLGNLSSCVLLPLTSELIRKSRYTRRDNGRAQSLCGKGDSFFFCRTEGMAPVLTGCPAKTHYSALRSASGKRHHLEAYVVNPLFTDNSNATDCKHDDLIHCTRTPTEKSFHFSFLFFPIFFHPDFLLPFVHFIHSLLSVFLFLTSPLFFPMSLFYFSLLSPFLLILILNP